MKKYLKILSMLIVSVMTFTACTTTSSSKVVAKVGTEDISYDEYLKKLALSKLQFDMYYGEEIWSEKMPNSDKTILDQFKVEILDKVIEDKIIVQEAKNLGLSAKEEETEKNFEQSKNSINSNEILKKYYSDNKIDEGFIKSIIVEDLTRTALQEKYFSDNPVTEEEINSYYEEHKSEFSGEQVKASHIILKTTDENGKEMTDEQKEEVKKKIKEIYDKIKAGGNFEELAKEHSQDGSKDKGGDLGYFSRGAMVKPFEDVAFSMNIGDISEPFETEFGYHIVKLVDKQEGNTDIAQVKEYIKSLLESDKFLAYIEELKVKVEIEKFEDIIVNSEKDIKAADLSALNSEEPQADNSQENTEAPATEEKK